MPNFERGPRKDWNALLKEADDTVARLDGELRDASTQENRTRLQEKLRQAQEAQLELRKKWTAAEGII